MNARSFIALLCLAVFVSANTHAQVGEQPRTLQSFGIQVLHGQPVKPLPFNVTLGLFDPDPLLDLACFVDGKLQVWQNLGDGTFGSKPIWERRTQAEVSKLEFKKSRMLLEKILDINSWGDLEITYVSGSSEKISHEQIVSFRRSFASLPQTSGVPPLDFREVWHSERANPISKRVLLDDLDGDGRVEMAYYFYPNVFDTSRSIKFVIYECVDNDSFVVDWDTVQTTFGGIYAITDLDKDGHKEIIVGYGPQTIPYTPRIGILECFGPRKYRFYDTNIGIERQLFQVRETDTDHDGTKELTVLQSNPSLPYDQTFIYVAEFAGKGQNQYGWNMAFNQELARLDAYCFDLAVGQMDGVGRDELVPAGGAFGYHEPIPVYYLWYDGTPGVFAWHTREIYTGLESGAGAVMFTNLDDDTTMEFISGAPGPIGHGSLFVLDHLHDTTWRVMWVDSTTIRNSPLWVNVGNLYGSRVVAGANTYQPNADTTWSWLHAYASIGQKIGEWYKDGQSIQQFHIGNIDGDNYSDLVYAELSHAVGLSGNYLRVFETTLANGVIESRKPVEFSLYQNYPNPFNPTTTIKFSMSKRENVRLSVFNLLGQQIETLLSEIKEPGVYTVHWDASEFASGVYFYRLETASHALTKKMLYVK